MSSFLWTLLTFLPVCTAVDPGAPALLGLSTATGMQGRQEEKASGGNLINWEWGPETESGAGAISAFSYTALKPQSQPQSPSEGGLQTGVQVRVTAGAGRGRGRWGEQRRKP